MAKNCIDFEPFIKSINEHFAMSGFLVDNNEYTSRLIYYSSFGFRLWGWIYCIKKALSISVCHGKWVN